MVGPMEISKTACQLPDFGGPPIFHAITFGGGLRGIEFDDEMGSGGAMGSSDEMGSGERGTFLNFKNTFLLISSSQV
jgi:hypothetical protein